MHRFQSVLFRRTLALAILLPTIGLAQTTETGNARKAAEKKLVRFVCTEIAPDTPDTLFLLGRDGIEEVPLSTRSPGDLFEIPAHGEIRLGLKSGNPENPIIPLAVGRMPEGTTRATAMLVNRPAQADGTRYKLLLINDSELEGGSVYFLNMTRLRSAAKLDGEPLILPPGEPVIYQPEGLENARNSPIAVMVETYDDGKSTWRPLMSSTWRLRKSRIEVCIVYWNEKYQRPSIKGLTLFPMSNESR